MGTDRFADEPAAKDTEQTNDVTRRDLAVALLGAFGGAALLQGCAEPSVEDADQVGAVDQGLTGTTTWYDTVLGASPALSSAGSAGTTSGQIAVVAGRSVIGDGGGGVFIWDPASSATADNALIVQSGTSSGRWKRLFAGPVNVKWFGAIGDGATNDTSAIQNAINAVLTGGEVEFPSGTYRHTTVTLGGARKLTIRYLGGARSLNDTTGGITPYYRAHDTEDVSFDSCVFVGTFLTDTAATFNSPVATDNGPTTQTKRLRIINCKAINIAGDFCRLGPNTFDTLIQGNHVEDCLGFVEMSGVNVVGDVRPVRNTVIRDNLFLGAPSAANSYRPSSISGSDDMIDMYGGIDHVLIEGNIFDGRCTTATSTCANHGVLIIPASDHGPVSNVRIRNNVFRQLINDGSYDPASGGVIVAVNPGATTQASSLVVDNNLFENCYTGFYSGNNNGAGSAVRQNTFVNCRRPVFLDADPGSTGGDWLIESNLVVACSGSKAIRCRGDRHVLRHNHVLLSGYQAIPGGENSYHSDIYVTSGTGVRVHGNRLAGSLTSGVHGVRLVAGTGTVCEDNRVDDHVVGVEIQSSPVTGAELRSNTFRGCTTNVSDAGTATRRDAGLLSIADTLPSATVSIAQQPDTAYLVVVTPQTFASGAATGSNRVLSITKTATQFTATVEAAPGSGKTNTFAWQIIRQ